MKFATNRYDVDFHVVLEDPAPIAGTQLEHHPFGVPPFDNRPIWTVEIASLCDLLDRIQKLSVSLEVSLSGYWSGASLEDPGQRLFGIGLIDDPEYEIDPRNKPLQIRRSRRAGLRSPR